MTNAFDTANVIINDIKTRKLKQLGEKPGFNFINEILAKKGKFSSYCASLFLLRYFKMNTFVQVLLLLIGKDGQKSIKKKYEEGRERISREKKLLT